MFLIYYENQKFQYVSTRYSKYAGTYFLQIGSSSWSIDFNIMLNFDYLYSKSKQEGLEKMLRSNFPKILRYL